MQPPAGEDALAYGARSIDFYNANDNLPENPSPLRFTIEESCLLSRGTCSPDDVFSNLDAVPPLVAANDQLLDRYEALQTAPVFAHVLRPAPDSPILPLRSLVLAQYLVMRHISYLATKGESDAARTLLQRETRFHRELLANADRLNLKMVAALVVEEGVRLHVLLLARAIELGDDHVVARLNERERALVAAISYEIVIDLNVLYDTESRADIADIAFDDAVQRAWFRLLPFRRNATANQLDLPIFEVAEASLLNAQDLLVFMEDWAPPEPRLVQRLNNGAGLMFIDRAKPPPLWNYLFRIHDLDRKLLLAAVAEKMLRTGITRLDATEWLATLSDEYRDPLTGEFPRWEDGRLGYPNINIPNIELPNRATIDLPVP